MDDLRYNGGEQLNIHDEGARRLTLDALEEQLLEVDTGDGHALTARPPVGTVGGPPAVDRPPTTPEHTVASGGGPATHQEMPATERVAQNLPTSKGG